MLSSINALAFLIPSLPVQTAPQYSYQATHPCFHYLCIYFLSLSLTIRLIHASFLPPLRDLLY